MPLVVSSLMGDASDVFDWIHGLNSGRTQDLTTLLQMLKEHYCGFLTFREQRNTIENLCQKRAPYLNLDAFCRFIGPKNLGKALINDELVTCLLDNGAQLNFIMPTYAQE